MQRSNIVWYGMRILAGLPTKLTPWIYFAFATLTLSAGSVDEAGSPRLTQLFHQVQARKPQATAAFWKDLKTPLIEAIPGDPGNRRVTFLWRGTAKTTNVTMMGGLPAANILKRLTRLADTDVWHLTELHSTQARFGYVFQINGPETLPMEMTAVMEVMRRNPPRVDPLNTNGYAGWSYVELPDAPPQPWITPRHGVPVGRKIKHKFKSDTLGREYSLSIYVPPGYDQGEVRCWLMIAFDGGFRKMDVSLDNLLANGKIPPLVVVGVENISSQTRMRDLNCSGPFATFIAKELVPWTRETYRVYDDPTHTIVGGISLGGKMAAYCGLKHSEVFGKVLSQSGSFLSAAGEESPAPVWNGEPRGMLVAQYLESPRLPLEFYIEVGRYETTLPFSPLLETRRLRDVLSAKGYRVHYSEFTGGHNEVCWRGSFADAIMALTAGQ